MTTTPDSSVAPSSRGLLAVLNGRYHKIALWLFLFIVVAHWAEHLVQAFQIWALDWPRPQARGALGMPFPWLIQQEWLHYAYAIVMLVGLWVLRPAFKGRSRTWWTIALGIQFWHHVEHLLLLLQALTGNNLLGRPVPTSIVQLIIPRVELHLFYNVVVFAPMVVAMYLHLRPNRAEGQAMTCSCKPKELAGTSA